jgi:hypothetical protein
MRKLTFVLVFIAFTGAFPANVQQTEFVRVSSKDVIDQLDAAILMDELQNRSPRDTVLLVKEIITLNKLQILDAEQREYDSKHPGPKSPLAKLGDLREPFYELRNGICKDFSGILVDLDGQIKSGCDKSAKAVH